MGLRDGYHVGDALGFGPHPVLADGDVHVGRVPLQSLDGTQADQILAALGLEGVAAVALDAAGHEPVLEASPVVLLRLDDLAGEFHPLEALVGVEAVDIDDAGVDQDADGVRVGGVRVGAVDAAFEQFWVVLLDVLGRDDDLDLG